MPKYLAGISVIDSQHCNMQSAQQMLHGSPGVICFKQLRCDYAIHVAPAASGAVTLALHRRNTPGFHQCSPLSHHLRWSIKQAQYHDITCCFRRCLHSRCIAAARQASSDAALCRNNLDRRQQEQYDLFTCCFRRCLRSRCIAATRPASSNAARCRSSVISCRPRTRSRASDVSLGFCAAAAAAAASAAAAACASCGDQPAWYK